MLLFLSNGTGNLSTAILLGVYVELQFRILIFPPAFTGTDEFNLENKAEFRDKELY